MDAENKSAIEKVLSVVDQAIDTGQIEQAVALLDSARNRWQDNIEIAVMGVKLLLVKGDQKAALGACRDVLKIQAGHPTAIVQLGVLELQTGSPDLAIKSLTHALDIYPEDFGLYKWLGHAYHEIGDIEHAVEAYEQALTDPAQEKDVVLPLAFAYRNVKNMAASSALLEKETAVNPDNLLAKFTLGQNLLLQGNLKEGFVGYESHWEHKADIVAQLPCPLWRYGDSIEGKSLLVFDEQGFGDCIQFSRFLPEVARRTTKVQLRLRPKLHKLITHLIGDYELVETLADTTCELAIPMMSLPLALELGRNDIANDFSSPHLTIDPDLTEKWTKKLEEDFNSLQPDIKKIGLIWQGDPNSPAEQGRSLTFKDIIPFFDQKNCKFYLLQMSEGEPRPIEGGLPDNVMDLGDQLDNDGHAFVDTAAVMGLMDLVISSDTSTAHLAGGLGCPTWVMLKFVPEWRWELEGHESYWYQTVKLFRQSKRADWNGVIEEVSSALKLL